MNSLTAWLHGEAFLTLAYKSSLQIAAYITLSLTWQLSQISTFVYIWNKQMCNALTWLWLHILEFPLTELLVQREHNTPSHSVNAQNTNYESITIGPFDHFL